MHFEQGNNTFKKIVFRIIPNQSDKHFESRSLWRNWIGIKFERIKLILSHFEPIRKTVFSSFDEKRAKINLT